MNQHQRTLIAHGAIAVSLLVGAYVVLVDRVQQKLASTRAEVAVMTSQVREAEHFRDMVPELASVMKRAEAESTQIKRHGAYATDERSLYTRLMALAAKHEVTLDEVNPTNPSTPPAPERRAGETPAGPGIAAKPVEHAVAYSMTATATYSHLASFLRSVQSELGYSAVKDINVSPLADERGLVRAVIATEHYAFDVTPKVATVDEGGKDR